jgi:hypothetical protein
MLLIIMKINLIEWYKIFKLFWPGAKVACFLSCLILNATKIARSLLKERESGFLWAEDEHTPFKWCDNTKQVSLQRWRAIFASPFQRWQTLKAVNDVDFDWSWIDQKMRAFKVNRFLDMCLLQAKRDLFFVGLIL